MKYDISKNKIKLKDSISLDDIGVLKTIMDEELPKKSKKLTIEAAVWSALDSQVRNQQEHFLTLVATTFSVAMEAGRGQKQLSVVARCTN